MIKNTLALTLLSAVVLTSLPVIATAHPGYGRHHDGRGAYVQAPALSQDQIAQMDKFCEEHRAALQPLRDQLIQKRMELLALSPNPNVKPEELKALTAEITKLHEQIRAVNDDFFVKMDKAGLPCRGYYHGRSGYHASCGDYYHGYHGRGGYHHGYGCGYAR